MPNFNDSERLRNIQYHSPQNLEKRMAVHRLYSTNKQGFSNWIFEHYALREHRYVLELGCGNGLFWKDRPVPQNVKILLSDFSEGMLDAAKENLKGLNHIRFKVMDAQKIVFDDNTFDSVIANHMLYHVPDIRKALSEISRVLKPSGVFYASTFGAGNMSELTSLLRGFDTRIQFATASIAEVFGLETGKAKLEEFFGTVDMDRYDDSLHITEVQPLVDFILSSPGIGNVNEIITGDRIDELTGYLSGVMAEKGYIHIGKDAGLFISRDPAKQKDVSGK